jgi:hypothetical protein
MTAARRVLGAAPTTTRFVSKTREHIFDPLALDATFFDQVSLAKLPLGFHFYYDPFAYKVMAPGHPFFPAIFGSAGIIATANVEFGGRDS